MMTWERPWIKEFESLAQQLVDQKWAKIKDLSDSSESESIGLGWLYPEAYFRVDDFNLILTVSDSSGFGEFIGSGRSRVEYLRISSRLQMTYKIGISHEGFFDRLSKKLHLQFEHETGNPGFDRQYLIRADSQSDRELINSGTIQEAIFAAEPFETIALWGRVIQMSQMIETADDLLFENAETFINRIVGLLEAVAKIEGRGNS